MRPTRSGCRSPSVLRASRACWCCRRARADGGWPTIACFGGSEGGFDVAGRPEPRPLAARGFAALAACWISEEDAAAAIASVPLERFADAVRLLADHPEVDGVSVVAMAVSRGAEGALSPRPTTEPVADPAGPWCWSSPSSVSWQAIGGNRGDPGHPVLDARGRPFRGVRCAAAS